MQNKRLRGFLQNLALVLLSLSAQIGRAHV